MRRTFCTFVIVGLLLAFVSERAGANQFLKKRTIDFYYRISRLPTDSPDTALVWFSFAFPYDHLVFVSSDSGYSAGFHFSIYVLDKDRSKVFEKSWGKQIFTKIYEETNSDSSFCRFSTFYRLPAGEYKLVMEAIDANVKKPEYFEKELKIIDYTKKKISVGDLILFLGKHNFADRDYHTLIPAATNIIRSDFTLMSQIYMNDPDQRVEAKVIWFEDSRKVREDSLHIHRNIRTLTLFRAYSLEDAPNGEFEVQFRIFGQNMRTKATVINLEIIKPIAFLDEQFLDKAIEQMIYIGEGEAWDSLRNAKTLEKKRYWFNRFWKEYYPGADSTRNPVQEEYFRRIRYTNRKFAEDGGWRSDRGRIYILYGPPNDIQRSVDNLMRRYEIWTYYNIEKQFVFLDVNDSGKFRLIRVN